MLELARRHIHAKHRQHPLYLAAHALSRHPCVVLSPCEQKAQDPSTDTVMHDAIAAARRLLFMVLVAILRLLL